MRQATAEDLEILDRIHTENMKGYVESPLSRFAHFQGGLDCRPRQV